MDKCSFNERDRDANDFSQRLGFDILELVYLHSLKYICYVGFDTDAACLYYATENSISDRSSDDLRVFIKLQNGISSSSIKGRRKLI